MANISFEMQFTRGLHMIFGFFRYCSSRVTSKPANGGQVISGQRISLESGPLLGVVGCPYTGPLGFSADDKLSG
jgi:hypothetical protein